MDEIQVSFGTYIFQPTPAKIRVESARAATAYSLPDSTQQLIIAGKKPTRVELAGELFAEDTAGAREQYAALNRLYQEGQAAVLCVPGQEPFYALFTALTLTAAGDGRVLDYTAEFTEGGEKA